MIPGFLKTALPVMALLAVFAVTAPSAHALEMERHVANGDTYVVTYAPRTNPDTGAGEGYYVEQHYNFALKKLVERFYGQNAVQVVASPFSDFASDGGKNYIADVIKPAACDQARKQKDAADFIALVCSP